MTSLYLFYAILSIKLTKMQIKISTKPPITIPAIAPPFNAIGTAAAPTAIGAILGLNVGGLVGAPVTPTVGSGVGLGDGRCVGLLIQGNDR